MRVHYPLLLLLLMTSLSVQAQSKINNTSQLILEFSKGSARKANFKSLEKKYEHINAEVEAITLDNHIAVLRFDSEEVVPEELMKDLRKSGLVHSVQIDHQLELRSDPPNDNLREDQWYMDIIKAGAAWELSKGGTNSNKDTIVIAVIDDGFDLQHEDLNQNIWLNRGEIPNDGIDNDGNGFVDDYQGWNFQTVDDNLPKKVHGTSVLGLMGAEGNNQRGITGLNWNVKLMPISIPGSVSSLISAFDYVRHMRELYNESNGTKGAFIVASSYSGGKNFQFAKDNPLWCSMYDALGKVGVLSVGATANLNADVDVYGDMPSTCPSDYLIVVTSTDEIDTKIISAGYGPKSVDIGAPGINLITTHVDDVYHHFSGTSAATPLVSGAIGLLYSIPNMEIHRQTMATPDKVALKMKAYILNGASEIEDLKERSSSGGRLDMANAVRQFRIDNGSPKGGIQLINAYPNPSTEYIRLDFQIDDLQPIHICVYNGLGQIMLYEKNAPSEFPLSAQEIDTSQWPTGYYFVRINQGNFVKTIKVSVLR